MLSIKIKSSKSVSRLLIFLHIFNDIISLQQLFLKVDCLKDNPSIYVLLGYMDFTEEPDWRGYFLGDPGVGPGAIKPHTESCR